MVVAPMKKICLAQIAAVVAALAALAAAAYVIYRNWELIVGFVKENCPACRRRAKKLEFEDYVD